MPELFTVFYVSLSIHAPRPIVTESCYTAKFECDLSQNLFLMSNTPISVSFAVVKPLCKLCARLYTWLWIKHLFIRIFIHLKNQLSKTYKFVRQNSVIFLQSNGSSGLKLELRFYPRLNSWLLMYAASMAC